VAKTTTCPHGLDSGTCLICSTLGNSPAPASTARIPAGKPEVLSGRPPRRHLSAVGYLVVIVAVLVVAWFLYHLVWGLLRLVELGLVGVVCGMVGYKIGVAVGRRRR
jgi:hypothetical protein